MAPPGSPSSVVSWSPGNQLRHSLADPERPLSQYLSGVGISILQRIELFPLEPQSAEASLDHDMFSELALDALHGEFSVGRDAHAGLPGC